MKILLDCDTGIDDAIAILLLAHEGAEVLGVSTVHGNVSAVQAARNSRFVLDLAGLPNVPVRVGCETPLVQEVAYSPQVHGEDGLGGFGPREGDVATGGVEAILEAARAHPGEITLVATGPLTNLAAAIVQAPELGDVLKSVVIMGGAVQAAGNISMAAEANIWHDPEAADIVFARYPNVTLVALDVTMGVHVSHAQIAELAQRGTERAAFAAQILAPYADFYATVEAPGCVQHDALAAALALTPEAASYAEWPLHVSLGEPLTRGQTVAERRPAMVKVSQRPLVKVATSVDAAAMTTRILAAL